LITVSLGLLNFGFLSKTTFYNSQKINHFALKRESSSSSSDYAVEIIDVTKRYDLGSYGVAAVNRLSMKVRHGEILAIMGPSGSGKSTLLNLIGALDRPTSGKILIDGVDISTLNDSGLAKLRNEKIGFVFQSYNLINRSKVLRNMELPAMVKGVPKEDRLKKVHDLLSAVGLDEKAERKPKMMSGGEQQRVAIARALVNDPKILLADEPTGNLDSKTGHEIMEYLRKTSQERGTTAIIVTHNREIAEIADRIIHFRDGLIVNEEVLRGRET
jgi:putative ABC transport system ATP-binding protein